MALLRRTVPRPATAHAAAADPAEVRHTYAPHPDGKPDPGEVVWAWLPFEDKPNEGKDRPGIVVGWIGDQADLAIVPVTSKRRGGSVPIGTGAWDRLKRLSYAKVDQLYRVPRSEVRREGSTLPLPAFERVLAAMRSAERLGQ